MISPRSIAFLTGVFAAALCAQSYYGGLRGTALDQNGGSVAEAKITLTDQGTREQRSMLSTATGEFTFSEVVPARYTLSVESPGFKKFEQRDVVVGTQEQVSLNVNPQVGQLTESVQVTERCRLSNPRTHRKGRWLTTRS
jgi:hypothetical protein